MFEKLKSIGPGAMVAAAFIGPGTITTATIAGGNFGYTLLWAVLFSTIACLVLQEMSARLGVVGQLGVGEAIRVKLVLTALRIAALSLVIGAILVGNAAYEAGNIAGGAVGLDVMVPRAPSPYPSPFVLVVAIAAFALLWTGKYRFIERTLVTLVAVMGLVFLVAAILSGPDWSQVVAGLFTPRIPENGWLKVIGLIGTTVVPYNLFLHASSAKQSWSGAEDLASARLDTVLSVSLGGVITAAILIAAAATAEQPNVDEMTSAGSLAKSLSTLAGEWSGWLLAIGFLAAGLSSTVTAPLAAAFATAEVFGWEKEMSDRRFRAIWILVLAVGVVFASAGIKPLQVIVFAQVANGLLLPIVAAFLVWVMNDKKIMGEHANSLAVNVMGLLVISVTLGLGVVGVLKGLGVL
jgi:Mn2+/Fe2+ NRAMP family transporter